MSLQQKLQVLDDFQTLAKEIKTIKQNIAMTCFQVRDRFSHIMADRDLDLNSRWLVFCNAPAELKHQIYSIPRDFPLSRFEGFSLEQSLGFIPDTFVNTDALVSMLADFVEDEIDHDNDALRNIINTPNIVDELKVWVLNNNYGSIYNRV